MPEAPLSVTVALADKIDMLTGFWAIDEKPTGSKDPFALRRAGLGVIRCILHNNLSCDLLNVLTSAVANYVEKLPIFVAVAGPRAWRRDLATDDLHETSYHRGQDLLSFLAERLKVVLRDEGMRHDVIDACFALGGQDDLVLLVARVWALQAFLATEDGANLLAAHGRASNIVAAEEKKDGPAISYEGEPEPKLAEQEEERALFAALDAAAPAIDRALRAEDFTAAMAEMAKLRAPVDAFFEAVLVNAENPILRRNRLCLLNRVRTVMGRVAVWDRLEG